jgi:hypothetical protein
MKQKQNENFEPTTSNDYLSLIEAKRHRFLTDKLLLNDLSDKIINALHSDDPNEIITQKDLYDLLARGVID